MSRVCELSQKGPQVGHRVSHSNIKTKHRFLPNLQNKRCWSTEMNRFVSIRLTAAALRTVDKLGIDTYAKKVGLKLT
jgi:large subunit ribosomal protein L28